MDPNNAPPFIHSHVLSLPLGYRLDLESYTLIDCKDIGGGSIHICHQYTQILNTSNVTSENPSINSQFLTVIILVNKLPHSLKKAARACFCH